MDWQNLIFEIFKKIIDGDQSMILFFMVLSVFVGMLGMLLGFVFLLIRG